MLLTDIGTEEQVTQTTDRKPELEDADILDTIRERSHL
jgi:hypothetical protein